MLSRLYSYILFLTIPPIVAGAGTGSSDPRKCYLMDGSSAPALSPCLPLSSSSSSNNNNSSESKTTHSPCCLLRNTTTIASSSSSNQNGKANSDTCLTPSGLCLSNHGLLYSSGCTDSTWLDPACPSICPDNRSNWTGKALEGKEWSQGQIVEHWQVMVCAAKSVCCRRYSSSVDCCGNQTVRVNEVVVGGLWVGFWALVLVGTIVILGDVRV
ncbi:hypothetical protein P170DRAFT_477444 [Aspergillus steynii IBT 23096]|uniref:Uncharacterized protein n=1 Tax=Aspergillus steynii IBT 23096 TaxID=1392250 RepID=A0A2I2G0Z4_9EURO|nr:uncharacterized protein P170DRAFT_477444 [Aspergillus steynii IBT 23096]PLB46564.1 hypothetical protein P170DRAFT_477444 [Aspergillus steynii IBT 23096]